MKKCPKCEFIYEDDQSLCDMDGALLVLDSRTLPNLHALQTVPAKASSKRNRAVPAFATLILAVVLGLVYYVSVQRRATGYDIPPQPTAATMSNPAPVVNPTPEAQPAAEEPKPEPRKPEPAAAAVPAKRVAAKPAPTPTKAKVEEKKDDSKVGNFLKKTGRILKKPFKF
jgi:cytoskeletal protein RodZ